MKRGIILLAFVLIGFGVQAQNSLIKTSPGALAFGVFNACYEKTTGEKSSFQLSASAFFSGLEDINGDNVSAFGLGAGYRFYITAKEAPRGFYAMPQVGYSFGDGASQLGIGVDLGYQWVWDSGFVLDVAVGPTYGIAGGDDDTVFDNGILPRIILAVGYAF